MPNLRLSHDESKDITAYLLTLKNEKFEKIESISENRVGNEIVFFL